MKKTSLLVSAAIILVSNAFALLHAMRNRAGAPDAEITLTQRELRYSNSYADDDDSGVTLYLQWTDPGNFPWQLDVEKPTVWLDRSKLQQLGFACAVNPNNPAAGRYYQRQRSRRVFVALEYDGSAWRTWEEAHERAAAEQRARSQFKNWTDYSPRPSHLVAIDADLDPVKLRARHPDRAAVSIMPMVVGITLDPQRSKQVIGRIQQLPSSIHVPRPFSDEFRKAAKAAGKKDLSYRVHLRYGASFEPWITGVEQNPRAPASY
jgi:hypothetical protein